MTASPDSIDFFAKYGDWESARSITCGSSTSTKDISYYLASIREEVAEKAFTVLGIDTSVLEAYSGKVSGKAGSLEESVLGLYKSVGSSDAESEVDKAAKGREELRPFAKAYLLRAAMRKLGLMWYISRSSESFGKMQEPKKGDVPFPSDGISFMAKYGDWISVKKLSIDKNTKPEEVAAHLSSIRITTDRKIAQILGVDTDSLDAYAETITRNMRKSAANLQKVVASLGSAGSKAAISAACNDVKLEGAAMAYMFGRMMQSIRIDLEVSPDTLMDMFPGLKIPKPKGRMPGQKKKKA